MAMVLDVLEDAAYAASQGGQPDIELIDEIMHYMTVYPDAVHHPKEDIVYRELQSRRPDLAAGVEDVPADHRDIAALGTQLRNDLDAIVAGAAVKRDQFVNDVNGYVLRLRNHMRWEEEDLFPRIDKMMEHDAPPITLQSPLQIKDPVFQLEIEPAFQNLIRSLRRP